MKYLKKMSKNTTKITETAEITKDEKIMNHYT